MLYEPTNIIPSTKTMTGTVAATEDMVNIQWQVNGNSAMTMFQIDVMDNNTDSTFVSSTGIVEQNVGGASLPFYGKDRFGAYIPFEYAPNQTWRTWSGNEIEDGNEYKFTIIQFFAETNLTYKLTLTNALTEGETYYFSYTQFLNTTEQQTYYIQFTVADASLFPAGASIYYCDTHQTGWIVLAGENPRIKLNMTFSRLTEEPASPPAEGTEEVVEAQTEYSTNLGSAYLLSTVDILYGQYFTASHAPSAFITRSKPSLNIANISSPVETARITTSATYTQAQGDNVRSVRWQLYNTTDNVTADDTGVIYTPVLQYEYNGLFNNTTYQLICTVETENNITVSDTQQFNVSYTATSYTGNFLATPNCCDGYNELMWNFSKSIPGVASPSNGAVVSGGKLKLNANATVTWNQETGENNVLQAMNLPEPWTVVWKGDIDQIAANKILEITNGSSSIGGTVRVVLFNPAKTLLVLGGESASEEGFLYLYAVSGNSITYISEITQPSAFQSVGTAAFSANGSLLVVGTNGSSAGQVSVYSVNGTTVAYKQSLSFSASAISFSPNGQWLALAVSNEGRIGVVLYRVSGQTITYWQDLSLSGKEQANAVAFSKDSRAMIATVSGFPDSSKSTIFSFSTSAASFVETMQISVNGYLGRFIEFDANNQCFLVGSDEGAAIFLLLPQTTQIQYLGDYAGRVYSTTNGYSKAIFAKFNDDETTVVIGFADSSQSATETELFNATSHPFISIESLSNNTFLSADFNDGRLVVGGSGTGTGTGGGYAEEYSLTNQTSNGILFTIPNNTLTVRRDNQIISVTQGNVQVSKGTIVSSRNELANRIVVYVNEDVLGIASFYNDNWIFTEEYPHYDYSDGIEQDNITSLQLIGEQTCYYFSVLDYVPTLYQLVKDPDFKPQWVNADGYKVYMSAGFENGLDGGTGLAEDDGYRIYRRNENNPKIIEVATLPSTASFVRDYGIKSNESYIYDLYVYDKSGAFMGAVTTEGTTLRIQFGGFFLLATQFNETDGSYHVQKIYKFSCNLSDMNISNNNNKAFSQNFTPYPTEFRSTANYASGTLQGLIGKVDQTNNVYEDSVELMDELYALSTTDYILFLKDMKGHIWQVSVGAVQQSATQKTKEMQVTISLPWTQIGDASGLSIIQTNDDVG